MKRQILAIPVVMVFALMGCGGDGDGDGNAQGQSADDQPAKETGQAFKVDFAANDVGKRLCSALTQDEIGKLVGEKVETGEVSGPLGSACTWDLPDDLSVMVQVVPPEYWEPHDTQGHRELTGIADQAYVERSGFGDGWVAGAMRKDLVVVADVGGDDTEKAAIDVLKLTLTRLK